eukprot:1668070-Pyramimonas_sp.AAC.1
MATREELTGINLLRMSAQCRLFPQDWPREMKVITSAQMACRHPLDRGALLGNGSAKLHKCGARALRLSYESIPLAK